MHVKYLAAAAAGALSIISLPSVSAENAPGRETMPSVALPAELERVLRDYERAWMARDIQDLAALFNPDGLALPNGGPPARGATEIARVYTANAGSPLSLRALAYDVSGDLAYIVGGFAPGAGKPDFGKFVLVLRKADDGRWLIAADMDNVNAMPPRVGPQQGAANPVPR